jgi:hypothetical protein
VCVLFLVHRFYFNTATLREGASSPNPNNPNKEGIIGREPRSEVEPFVLHGLHGVHEITKILEARLPRSGHVIKLIVNEIK